jgi:type VI protein secretion system component VasF
MNLERELTDALQRQAAPQSLRQTILWRIAAEDRRRRRTLLGRIAATFAFVALLGYGGSRYAAERNERREGEAAKQQVLLAMKITSEKTSLAKRAMQHEVQ